MEIKVNKFMKAQIAQAATNTIHRSNIDLMFDMNLYSIFCELNFLM